MIRTLAIVAGASFVVAALCLGGAAALVGPDLAKSDFWRELEGVPGVEVEVDTGAPSVTQLRELTGFTSVDIGGGLDAEITVGPEFKIEVIGPEPDLITTELDGTTLDIYPRPRNWWRGTPRTHVRVSLPVLVGAGASAGASMGVTGMTGGDVTLDASAGASLDIAGTCNAISAEASSGGHIDAEQLICASGSAGASSGGSLEVHVTGPLNVDASSGGSVEAAGNPQLGEISLSSGGSFDPITD